MTGGASKMSKQNFSRKLWLINGEYALAIQDMINEVDRQVLRELRWVRYILDKIRLFDTKVSRTSRHAIQVTCLLIGILIGGCNDDISQSTAKISIFDKLEWECDTLSFQGTYQTDLTELWGHDPSLIVVAGFCSSRGGDVWEYNGTSWRAIMIEQRYQSTSDLSPSSVFGRLNSEYFLAGERISLTETGFLATNNRSDNLVKMNNHIYSGAINSKGEIVLGADSGAIYLSNGVNWESVVMPVAKYSEGGTRHYISDVLITERSETYAIVSTYERSTGRSLRNVYKYFNKLILSINLNERLGSNGEHVRFYLGSSGSVYIFGGNSIYQVINDQISEICDLREGSSVVSMAEDQYSNLFAMTEDGEIFRVEGMKSTQVARLENDYLTFKQINISDGHVFVLARMRRISGGIVSLVFHGIQEPLAQ